MIKDVLTNNTPKRRGKPFTEETVRCVTIEKSNP